MKKIVVVLGLIASISMVACSKTNHDASNDKKQNLIANTDIQGKKEIEATVNGNKPKEKIGANKKVLYENKADGLIRIATRIDRMPNTRSAIHYMNYPVVTCVIKGNATLVLEGQQNQVFKSGECYSMPKDIKGYVVNSNGANKMQIIDYNTYPIGKDPSRLTKKRASYLKVKDFISS